MKHNPFQLRDDCVKYRIIEIEHTNAITKWAIACTEQGADLWFDFANRAVWVIVPEVLLLEFLKQFGNSVSGL